MSFHSYFHIKDFAPDLALKKRLKAARKWPIESLANNEMNSTCLIGSRRPFSFKYLNAMVIHITHNNVAIT